jgi:hypothetical protein
MFPYFLLGLFFNSEEGDDMFSKVSADFQWNTVLYHRRQKSFNGFLVSIIQNNSYNIAVADYQVLDHLIFSGTQSIPFSEGRNMKTNIGTVIQFLFQFLLKVECLKCA